MDGGKALRSRRLSSRRIQLLWADYANRLLLHKPSLVSALPPGLFSDVVHMPDGARTVVGHEHAAVFGDGDTDRPSPNQAVFRDETREEVFVTAISMAVVDGNADYFIA